MRADLGARFSDLSQNGLAESSCCQKNLTTGGRLMGCLQSFENALLRFSPSGESCVHLQLGSRRTRHQAVATHFQCGPEKLLNFGLGEPLFE